MQKRSLSELELKDKYVKVIEHAMKEALSLNLDYLTKIILFGSCAKGTAKLGSDVDLMYVTSEKLTNRNDRIQLECTLSDEYTLPDTDLVIYSESTLAEGTNPFTKSVRQHGIILWEKEI